MKSFSTKAAESSSKRQSNRLRLLDPRKDFKFFITKTKVCQVYREALQEAKAL